MTPTEDHIPLNSLLLVTGVFAVLLYLSAGGLLTRRLALSAAGRGETGQTARGLALLTALIAAMAHAALLYDRLFTPQGLDMGFFNALSLAGWLIGALMIVLATRQPVENLGIAILPLAALALALQLLNSGASPQRIGVDSPIQAHIVLSILAYGVFSIAALQAVLLALQDRQLHAHRPGGLIRALPPLRTMEALLFQMLGIGFALLSLALLSGALFLEDLFAQHLVHKTVLSLAAWVVFAILLWGRRRFGWRGRTAIRWTLGGFGALLLAYFGSKFVLELVLAGVR